MKRKHGLVAVGLAVLVVLAGCAAIGGDSGGDSAELAGGDGGDGANAAGVESTGDDGADSGESQQSVPAEQSARVDRAVVRTGTVELRSEEFGTTRSAVADHARSLGGYVSGSGSTRHSRDNRSWTTGYVVVRVPTGRFDGMLSFARERGTVVDEETQTEDVTDQLLDLDARLTNLQQRRDRLRSFYERANSTRELLDVESELSSVQSEIERLEAEKRSLEDRVAYATLRVEIDEPTPPTAADATAGASLLGTFRDSTATLLGLAYGFVLFGARLAPYLVFLGVPALLAGLLLRRRVGASPLATEEGENTATDPGREDTRSGGRDGESGGGSESPERDDGA